MNKLSEAEQIAESALRLLSHSWADVKQQWDDEAKRYFDAEYMHVLLTYTPPMLSEIRELSATFEQARREIE
jgi:hypothetical protein